LTSGLAVTANWNTSAGADSYDIEIRQADGTTVACALQSVNAPSLQLDFSACTLTDGSTYKVHIVARDAAGNARTASNDLFSFRVLANGPAVLSITDGASYSYGNSVVPVTVEHTFTLSNGVGATATTLTSVAPVAPFAFKGGTYPGTGGTCNTSLDPSTTCTIVVVFTPLAVGSFASSVGWTYFDQMSTQSLSIALSGSGISGPPTQLAISIPSATAVTECVPMQVQTKTDAGLSSAVAADTTVNLVVNNGTGTYYSNSGCTTTITSVVVTSGLSSASLYFKSTTSPQDLTLVASATGLANGTAPISIGPWPISLLISGPAQIVFGTCRAFSVSRINSSGQQIAEASSVTVNLTQTSATYFYADPACSGGTITSTNIASFAQSATFYLRDDLVEGVTLTATDAAAIINPSNKALTIAASDNWWDTQWAKRIAITVSNLDQATAFSDMPVMVKLNASRIDYADFQSAGQDVRFVDASNTPIPYEIEFWNPTGDSVLWTKVPSIAASSDTTVIYMYYKNPGAADAQSINSIWTSYWGVWHLGENPADAAPQFRDSTSNSHHGTAQGGPLSSTAVVGKGIDIRGANDVVDIGFDLATVIGRTSTFSSWIKTSQAGNATMWQAPGITGVESAGDGNDIFFGWLDDTGKIGVTAGNGAAAKSNFIVNDNAWRYVTITRSETTGAVQFFVNGVKNGTGTSETGTKTTAFQKFGIIGDTGGTPVQMDGFLDEIRIFNTVQTDARVKADYKYQVDTHLGYAAPETH